MIWAGAQMKTVIWIEDHIEKIKGAVLIASGATFDFFELGKK